MSPTKISEKHIIDLRERHTFIGFLFYITLPIPPSSFGLFLYVFLTKYSHVALISLLICFLGILLSTFLFLYRRNLQFLINMDTQH